MPGRKEEHKTGKGTGKGTGRGIGLLQRSKHNAFAAF